MKKRSFVLIISALFVMNSGLYAQFGLGKLGANKKDNSSNPAQAVVPTGDLIGLITLATDQGMQAMDILATAFPPEKIAQFKETSKKYHELQTHRKDGNIDAEQYQAASDAAAELAKLEMDWESYRKDEAQVIPAADHRLAYMLLADGLASLQIPPAVQSLQSEITSIGSNPFQMGKVKQLSASLELFKTIGQQMPKQMGSITTVRSISKKIATAEKMTLPPDPPADSLKDVATATNTIKKLPPDPPTPTPEPGGSR